MNDGAEEVHRTTMNVCLLARKSCIHPGTRFLARGLNAEGGATQFIGGALMFPVSLDGSPSMKWMVRTSVAYYAFEASLFTEVGDQDWGEQHFEQRGMEYGAGWQGFDIAVLRGIFVVLRLFVYILFRCYNVERR